MSYGIDYGMGTANVDCANGIRFGVVPMNALSCFAWESLESDYGPPHCPKCGNEAEDATADGSAAPEREDYETARGACGDYACDDCEYLFDSEDAFGDEAIGHTLDEDGYKGTVDSSGDLFILESPFYTHAQYCSPCAPGACYLLNPTDKGGPRAYCLSHDWYESGKAPYPVFRVADGSLVRPETK